jgi:23S rRNA pseudouridine1911/1915/1917 synthase
MEKNIKIIYEDPDIIVVNKPAGLMVHGVAGKISTEPTLTDILLKKYPEIRKVGDDPALRPGIVHRLDKDTSGVMVVARNQKSFEYLKSLFKGRDIKKKYIAVVSGVPKESHGVIDKPIGIQTGTTKRSVRAEKMAKPAVTEYEVLKTARAEDSFGKESSFALLSVSPKTGRTHQIRVHLTSIGHPIVGDPIYGPKKQPSWASRLMLHAVSIEFSDRVGGHMRFEAEVPQEFEKMFDRKTDLYHAPQ